MRRKRKREKEKGLDGSSGGRGGEDDEKEVKEEEKEEEEEEEQKVVCQATAGLSRCWPSLLGRASSLHGVHLRVLLPTDLSEPVRAASSFFACRRCAKRRPVL